MGLLLLLVVSALSAFICQTIADKRGLKPIFWGVLGFLFGPLVILIVLLVKPSEQK